METDSEAENLFNDNSVDSKKDSSDNSECDDSQYSSLACMRVFDDLPSSGDSCNYRHEFDCAEDETSNGKCDYPDCYYELDHSIRKPEPCFSNKFYVVAATNDEDDYSASGQYRYQDSGITRIPPEDETYRFPADYENSDSGFNSLAFEMSNENADFSKHVNSTYSDTVGHLFGTNNNSGSKCEYFVSASNNVASENNFLNPSTKNYETSQCAPSSTSNHHDTPWRLRREDDYQDSEGYQRGDDYNQAVLEEWWLARDPATTDASSSNFSMERASTTSSGYFSMPFIPQYSLARRASFAGRDLPRLVSSTDSSTAGDDQFFANNFPEKSAGDLSFTDSSSLNSLLSQFGASRINSLENLTARFEPCETMNFGRRNGRRKALLTSSLESIYRSDEHEFCRVEYSRYKRRRLVQKQKEPPQFKEEFPNEILVQILKYLPIRECIRQERVCKQWKQLVQLVLRHKKVISFGSIFGRDSESRCTPITLTNAKLGRDLSRCGDRARVASLEAFRRVITFEPKTLPKSVSRSLVPANFSYIQLNQETWITALCSCLTDVNFHTCFQTMRSIAQQCPKLALLELSGDYSVESTEGFKKIAKMSMLTSLQISSSSADDEVVEYIASGPVDRSSRGLVSSDLSHDKCVTDASVMAPVDYVEQRSAKQETLEKLTVKHLDSFLRDRVVINIPIAERCYHALAASVRNWNPTPFIDFREYCAKEKKHTDTLELHGWLGPTCSTRPHRNFLQSEKETTAEKKPQPSEIIEYSLEQQKVKKKNDDLKMKAKATKQYYKEKSIHLKNCKGTFGPEQYQPAAKRRKVEHSEVIRSLEEDNGASDACRGEWKSDDFDNIMSDLLEQQEVLMQRREERTRNQLVLEMVKEISSEVDQEELDEAETASACFSQLQCERQMRNERSERLSVGLAKEEKGCDQNVYSRQFAPFREIPHSVGAQQEPEQERNGIDPAKQVAVASKSLQKMN